MLTPLPQFTQNLEVRLLDLLPMIVGDDPDGVLSEQIFYAPRLSDLGLNDQPSRT